MRKPIAWAMLVLIAAFLGLSFFTSINLYYVLRGDNLNEVIIVGAQQVLYSAGAVGSILFMIRWMNRWFELHSHSEFNLKLFELDMERASWLVETSLEWKDAKGTAIPGELLESLSKNLFTEDSDKVEQLKHPADQLASALVGSSSNIRLKAGDSVLEIDPKKLSKSKVAVQSHDS